TPAHERLLAPRPGSGTRTSLPATLGTSAAGASRTATPVAAISPSIPAGTLTDSANVTSTTPEVNLANNSATFDTTVSTSADVSVTKTGPASVTAGSNVTYTLTTNNNGP